MEIKIDDISKTVEIWLTNAEKTDAQLRGALPSLYADYKAKKYTVAVFESGDGDLFTGTQSLLLRNRLLHDRTQRGA